MSAVNASHTRRTPFVRLILYDGHTNIFISRPRGYAMTTGIRLNAIQNALMYEI